MVAESEAGLKPETRTLKLFPSVASVWPCRLNRLLLPAIMLLALYFRLDGLENDLHLGRVYHPDAPKQMREVQVFLEGRYLSTNRGSDFDGYPFFTSYAASLLCRGYAAARWALRGTMGLPYEPFVPSPVALHRLMRGMNVAFSTAAVWLVFVIGSRFWSRPTGVVAAAWLAVSPIDVVAVKDATGDVLCAFMALAALYYALSVLRENRWRDYVVGGLCAAAAFAAKYQGGMVLLPFLAAHLVRFPPWRAMFSSVSIRKGLSLIAAFIAGVAIATPAYLVDAKLVFRDLRRFLAHTSGFGLSAEMLELSPAGKLAAGMRAQLPVLIDLIGPIVALAILVALGLMFVRARQGPGRAVYADRFGAPRLSSGITVSLPLLYLALGIALKPNAHIVYHSLITPALFMMAATVVVKPMGWRRLRVGGRLLTVALVLLSVVHLARHAQRENFFFRHNDTRLVAENWARDNIPPTVRLLAGSYTFDSRDWTGTQNHPGVTAYVYSARHMPAPAAGAFVMHAMDFEGFKLTPFRNWPIRFDIDAPEWIRPGFNLPPPQMLPSPYWSDMLCVTAPELQRSSRHFDLFTGQRRTFNLVSPQPLEEVLFVIRTAAFPALLRVDAGGRRLRLQTANYSSVVVPVTDLRPVGALDGPNHYYRVRLRLPFGYARVSVAVTPREKAWAWYRAGEYASAFETLEKVPAGDRGPAETILRLISGRLSGRLHSADLPADPLGLGDGLAEMREDAFLEQFGVAPSYFQALPYVRIGRDDLAVDIMEHGRHRVRTPSLLPLEEGCYRITIAGGALPPEPVVRLRDEWGRIFETVPLNNAVNPFEYQAEFCLTAYRHGLQLELPDIDPESEVPMEIRIQPDVLKTMNAYLKLYRELLDPEEADSGEPTGGYDAEYPVPLVLADAIFEDGYLLTGYRLDTRNARPGGELGLNLYWQIPPERYRSATDIAVWVHCLHVESDTVVFQGDRSLATAPPYRSPLAPELTVPWQALNYLKADLLFPAHSTERDPFMRSIPIPVDAPEGAYRIRVGLWKPHHNTRLRLRAACGRPHDRRSVLLDEFSLPSR